MTTDKLTNAQKGVVLRDLIFVKDEKLSIKQQSEQVLRSSQNIALFIEYNPLQLTEMASPKELETALQKEFSKAFHVEVDNFTEKFSKTFGSMRNPAAILTYASGLKSLPPSEEHAKLQPLLEECVEWILNQTFSTHCYSLQKNPSEHLEKLLEHTEIMENWKKEVIYDYDEYQVIFRRNAEDLILIGKGTCQTVDGDPLVNKCLGAYILDPKNSPAIIKKKGGTEIVARSMIRLLFDENENPVLFKEHLYTDAYSKGDFEKIITESCVKRAKQLKKEGGIPLLQKDKSCTKNVVTLKAYAGRWPYEMVDANGSIQGNKGFKIKSCAYLYKPEPKPS